MGYFGRQWNCRVIATRKQEKRQCTLWPKLNHALVHARQVSSVICAALTRLSSRATNSSTRFIEARCTSPQPLCFDEHMPLGRGNVDPALMQKLAVRCETCRKRCGLGHNLAPRRLKTARQVNRDEN
jgi:hypothetical protein